MADAPRSDDTVRSVAGAIATLLDKLDMHLLALVMLTAIVIGAVAHGLHQGRAIQHEEFTLLIQACITQPENRR